MIKDDNSFNHSLTRKEQDMLLLTDSSGGQATLSKLENSFSYNMWDILCIVCKTAYNQASVTF